MACKHRINKLNKCKTKHLIYLQRKETSMCSPTLTVMKKVTSYMSPINKTVPP